MTLSYCRTRALHLAGLLLTLLGSILVFAQNLLNR
jgi:hypothetical protein